MWLTSLSIVFALGVVAQTAAAADAERQTPEWLFAAPIASDADQHERADLDRVREELSQDDETDVAQFQLPPRTAPQGQPAPPPQLPRQLTYSYTVGSESEASHHRNSDLDDRLRDDFSLLTPQVNGLVTYRPIHWLQGTLEVILEREMLVQGDRNVLLPSDEIERRPDDGTSLLIDQAFLTIDGVTDPFSFMAGRRNYEDERHWLYDTSIDVGAIGFRSGRVRADATFGREVATDLDLLRRQQHDLVNTYMLYADYRAFEDARVAGYAIMRDDLSDQDGRFQLFGLRSFGAPVESLSYWVDVAMVRGQDETAQPFRGYGFDVGATYRFLGMPFNPNITLAYAFGSGDKTPDDGTNNQFRQTGLQSNEQKFAGLPEFKYYGEALDPELSNLHILTVGLGFRPIRDTSVDLVYHRYRLHRLAETFRNAALTAEMNQDADNASTDVGEGFDIVIGFRNVFGVQRLGIDLRGGWFFPGEAFRNERDDGSFEAADAAATVVVKLWW